MLLPFGVEDADGFRNLDTIPPNNFGLVEEGVVRAAAALGVFIPLIECALLLPLLAPTSGKLLARLLLRW